MKRLGLPLKSAPFTINGIKYYEIEFELKRDEDITERAAKRKEMQHLADHGCPLSQMNMNSGFRPIEDFLRRNGFDINEGLRSVTKVVITIEEKE